MKDREANKTFIAIQTGIPVGDGKDSKYDDLCTQRKKEKDRGHTSF